MSKYCLVILFTLLAIKLPAQRCDCASQFEFVRDYFESNNPAFQKIREEPKAYRTYLARVAKLKKRIRREMSPDRCNVWFEEYVALLKDHHSGVDVKLRRLPIDFSSQLTLDSFRNTSNYRSFEVLQIDSAGLVSGLSATPTSGVEGIYTNGSSITFALVKTRKNHYRGIVLKPGKFLEMGHVLLELQPGRDSTHFRSVYNTGLFGFSFQKVYQEIEVRDGRIPAYGFYRLGHQSVPSPSKYEFRAVDAHTNYLRLASFDYSLKNELDSFFASIDSAIRSKPNLVIDLRDNGGGYEQCYLELMKYIATKPFKIDEVDVWVSPENTRQYESSPGNEELVKRMKEARPFTFIPLVGNAVTEWSVDGMESPQKVAILFNRKTASSAEGMITYAIQSSKVVTLGENSGGFLGYGNVMTAETPCGNYTLRSTTTRYRENSRYEFVGIAPLIRLQRGTDWVEAARKALTQPNGN